jgi:adiponectin receptor
VLNPTYAKPTHRGARTAVFAALGLCGGLPMVHGLLTHGLEEMRTMGLAWLVAEAAFYLSGALL